MLVYALLGGALLGAASALLLLTHGRIAGISGIAGSLLQRSTSDRAWRVMFLIGLVAAGIVGSMVAPSAVGASPRSYVTVIIAGLLVGFGTRLGSGCTSGHGICGLARLSPRSITSVMAFLLTGVLTATLVGLVS